jgi:hypothetical protein
MTLGREGFMKSEDLAARAKSQGALFDEVAEESERIIPPIKYPKMFQSFLEKHLFSEFDIGPITIFSNIRGEDHNLLGLLEDANLIPPLIEAGFLPFGRPSTGDYDPICFDARGLEDPIDAPVVQIDHESILSRNKIPKPNVLAKGLGTIE